MIPIINLLLLIVICKTLQPLHLIYVQHNRHNVKTESIQFYYEDQIIINTNTMMLKHRHITMADTITLLCNNIDILSLCVDWVDLSKPLENVCFVLKTAKFPNSYNYIRLLSRQHPTHKHVSASTWNKESCKLLHQRIKQEIIPPLMTRNVFTF